MSSQPGKPAANPAASDAANSAVRVILADGQAIYRVGIRKIFAGEDDIRVVAQAESVGQLLTAAARFPADVVMLESAICANPADVVSEVLKRQAELKVIILTAEPGEEDTVDYLRRGVKGIVTRTISPDLLVKCVRRVAAGETWLDNRGVNWLVDAYRSQARQLTSPPPKARLSEKELRIIAGVTKGMRNKEIASEIGTTEQVVKNYLRKVYDKLGVSDRLELALYCVHHELLKGVHVKGAIEGAPPDEPGEPEGGPDATPAMR